jgi:eukaryotic-like serine/threonine-protein kinase
VDGCPLCFDLYASFAGDAAESGPARPRIDRYELGQALGAGAMGVVYDAFDTQLERHVAIKVLNPTLEGDSNAAATRRLLTEAKALAKLRHPHVVTVHDGGVAQGRVYLVMERIEGTSARELMHLEPRTDEAWCGWFRQAGRGLGAAHAQGIVHRDFKPANVLIGHDGLARVVDFGLAKPTGAVEEAVASQVSGPGADDGVETQITALVGTPAYLAPEVAAGRPATPRSDQYSFCVSLYEALHGVRPSRPPTFRRAVPRRIRAALRRGLSTSPDDRFPTMTELVRALEPSTLRRRLKLAVGASLGLAMALVIAFVAWNELRGPPYVVVSGRELAPHHREQLREAGLLEDGDDVQWLYSNGVTSIEDDLGFFTATHVVIHDPEAEPATLRIPLETIDEVIVMDEVSYIDFRFITLLTEEDEIDIPCPADTPSAERYADGLRRAIARRRRGD